MKKLLIGLLVISVLAFAGFYFYNNFLKYRNLDLWSFVPGTTVMVYETDDFVEVYNRISTGEIWQNLLQVKPFKQAGNRLEALDLAAGQAGILDQLLGNNKVLISLHPVSGNDFGFAFYFQFKNLTDQATFTDLSNQISGQENMEYRERVFLGQQIREIKDLQSGETFSFLLYREYFIGSYTSFLVEEVIRAIGQDLQDKFLTRNPFFLPLSSIGGDEGNLYLDLNRFPEFIKLFCQPEYNQELNQLKNFTSSSFLDLRVNENLLLFNGVSSDPSGSYLHTFAGQEPVESQLKGYISNRTAALFSFTYQNFSSWHEALMYYWSENEPAQLDTLNQMLLHYDLNLDNFSSWIQREIGLAIYETVNPAEPDKVLFIKTGDINEALNRLNRLSEKASEVAGDSVYREEYAGVPIAQLQIDDFPAKLLGPLFSGFKYTFYAPVGTYILLGNDIQTLKSTLGDIENEYTWGKSIMQTQFLENTMQAANLSLMVNTERLWNQLLFYFTPEWRQFFAENSLSFKRFSQLAFQVSNLDGRYYTSAAIRQRLALPQNLVTSQFEVVQEFNAEAPLISKPYVVRNHLDRSLEVMVQDSLFQLYLIDKDGEGLWKYPLEGPIVGDISQVDFYRNNKLQYFFGTAHRVYILDRNGELIPGYPMELPDTTTIDKLNVIDYDNSKRYRFLLADTDGDLFMYNKERQNLEGWQPRNLKNSLILPPQHFRVRGQDCILTIENNGIISMFNRRGEMYPGFPVNVNSEIRGEIFIELGSNFRNSNLITVNFNGEIITINLEGKVQDKKQLYKPTRETTFRLFRDALGKTFIIARQDFNRLSILNNNGDLIFEKDYLSSDELAVQYYHFSSANKIYAITDKTQDFTYIYDQEGQLINYQPLESGFEVGLLFSENNQQYKIYSCYQNSFTVSVF